MSTAAPFPIGRPSLGLLGTEPLRAAKEFIAHRLRPAKASARGDGHPVILFPGLGADGTLLIPLRDHCQSLGYEASDWGRGFNTGPQGDVDAWLAGLASDTAGMLTRHKQSATLIGWSLGGLYAREVAKLLKGRIRQVITIGTPFNAAADHTHAGWLYRLLSGAPVNFTPTLSARLRKPPPVPTTSIYSCSDGVVAWQTCRHDLASAQVQDVEVDGSHIGMVWNPSVLQVVGDRLAQSPGRWQPYAKPRECASAPNSPWWKPIFA